MQKNVKKKIILTIRLPFTIGFLLRTETFSFIFFVEMFMKERNKLFIIIFMFLFYRKVMLILLSTFPTFFLGSKFSHFSFFLCLKLNWKSPQRTKNGKDCKHVQRCVFSGVGVNCSKFDYSTLIWSTLFGHFEQFSLF